MKKMIFLFFFLLSNISLAMAGYDPICEELAGKWNLKEYRVFVNHTINDLRTVRKEVDKKVNDQISIWKKIQGSSDCLKVHAGIQFQTINGKDYLFVSDPNKLRNFRLNENRVKCDMPFQYSEFTTEHTILGKPVKTDYLGTPAVNPDYEKIRYDTHTYKNGGLQDNVNLNNSLGDVGLENYCIHHLQKYQLESKSLQIMGRRQICEQLKKDGKILQENKTIPVGGCEDFPDGMAKEMKALATEMENVYKETGYQPYNTMTAFDQNLYSSFKGNLDKLKEAKKMAEASMKWSYEAENYLQKNNLWSADKSLSNCGESNPINDFSFIEGQNQCSTYEPIQILETTNFTANMDVVKAVHRDNMIKEINGQAFAKTIESAYHLLEYDGDQTKQDLRKNLWQEFSSNKVNDNTYKTACSKMAPKNLCLDKLYFSQFKKGINNAMTKIKELDQRKLQTEELMRKDPKYSGPSPDNFNPPGTFLRYDDKFVAEKINSTFAKMINICRGMSEDGNIYGNPEVKLKWLKSYEDQFRYLQNFAGYFYDAHVRSKVKLDMWTATPGKCPDDIENFKESLTPEEISDAKNGFMRASKDQLKSISDFQKPDRGNHSNGVGEFFCGKYGKEKEDLYALSSLLTSHPFTAGQMVSAIDKAAIKNDKEKNGIDKSGFEIEKKIYTKLLCEAKECSQYVKNGNKNALNAVKIVATAVSLIPVPGTQAALLINIAATGVSVGAEIADQIIDYNVANRDLRLMQGGTLTGGFGDAYNNALAAKIESIKNNEADFGKLVAGIIGSISQEALQIEGAELAKLGLTDVISKALRAQRPADAIMNTVIPHLDAVEATADIAKKSKIKQLTDYLKQPGKLKLVVERGVDIPIGGYEINKAKNEMPLFNPGQ